MKDERFSLTQVRAMLGGIDQKTLKDWMQKAKVTPKGDELDKRFRYLTRADVERLAAQHGRVVQETAKPRGRVTNTVLLARIEALEAEIAALKESRTARYAPVPRQDGQETAERRRAVSQSRQRADPAGLPQRMGIGKNHAGKVLAVPHGANSWASASANWPWRDEDLATDEAALRFIRWYLGGHPQAGEWHECDKPDCPCHALDSTSSAGGESESTGES